MGISEDLGTREGVELHEALAERDLLRARLTEAEQLLARVPDLEVALDDATARAELLARECERLEGEQAERERLAGELKLHRAEIERMGAALDDVWRSPSWRLTAPLRTLKRLLGGASGR